MGRPLALSFSLASLLATAAWAQVPTALQNTYVAAPDSHVNSYSQRQPATIERGSAHGNRPGSASAPRVQSSEVVTGVWVRSEAGSSVQTLSADANGTELRVESGRINVAVHHPALNSEILVDLPGGQAALVKDGLYAFNAGTDTIHVLEGEADVFPEARDDDGIKVKDDSMYVFGSGEEHATLFESYGSNNDLLPGSFPSRADAYSRRGDYGRGFLYADGPGYGFAPYYGFGYPYGYGFPYGYGWGPWGYGPPLGVSLGFGYYGGFRGGFGGFHGRGFGGFRGHR